VNFTVSVTGNSGTKVPTGTFSFTDNGVTLGTATVSSSGTASFSTTGLPAGTDSVIATYSGDSTYLGSTSNEVPIIINPLSTFTLNISPANAQINAGQSATFNMSVTPQGGFNQAVSFACSGLPAGGACSFSPATVTPGGAAVVSTLTIALANSAAVTVKGLAAVFWTRLSASIVLALLIWPVRRVRRWSCLVVMALFAGGMLLCGCGSSSSSSSPQTPTYTVTVTATGGGVSQAATVSITTTD
jgi:hypothetical protein